MVQIDAAGNCFLLLSRNVLAGVFSVNLAIAVQLFEQLTSVRS